MSTIHVYKTSIISETEAKTIAKLITRKFPSSKISFDLEDCDKVLRVETQNSEFDEEFIRHIFITKNHRLETLPF